MKIEFYPVDKFKKRNFRNCW